MNLVKGQLVELSYRESESEDAWWEYGVVKNIFDGRIEIIREQSEGTYMHVLNANAKEDSILNNQPTKTMLIPLTVNCKPVMAKKIFGKYTFKPKN